MKLSLATLIGAIGTSLLAAVATLTYFSFTKFEETDRITWMIAETQEIKEAMNEIVAMAYRIELAANNKFTTKLQKNDRVGLVIIDLQDRIETIEDVDAEHEDVPAIQEAIVEEANLLIETYQDFITELNAELFVQESTFRNLEEKTVDITANLDELNYELFDVTETLSSDNETSIENMKNETIITSSAMAAFTFLLTLVLFFFVARPIGKFTVIIRKISEQDTSVDTNVRSFIKDLSVMGKNISVLKGQVTKAFEQGQMIDDMQLPIIACNPRDDFRVSFVNKAMGEVAVDLENDLSCASDDLMDKTLPDVHEVFATLNEVIADPENLPWAGDIQIGVRHYHIKATAVYDNEGEYLSL